MKNAIKKLFGSASWQIPSIVLLIGCISQVTFDPKDTMPLPFVMCMTVFILISQFLSKWFAEKKLKKVYIYPSIKELKILPSELIMYKSTSNSDYRLCRDKYSSQFLIALNTCNTCGFDKKRKLLITTPISMSFRFSNVQWQTINIDAINIRSFDDTKSELMNITLRSRDCCFSPQFLTDNCILIVFSINHANTAATFYRLKFHFSFNSKVLGHSTEVVECTFLQENRDKTPIVLNMVQLSA